MKNKLPMHFALGALFFHSISLSGDCIFSTVGFYIPHKHSVSNMSFGNNYQNILEKAFSETDFGFFPKSVPYIEIILHDSNRLNDFLKIGMPIPYRTYF